MLDADTGLTSVLTEFCLDLEQLIPGSRLSVLLLDGQSGYLKVAAGPGIPEELRIGLNALQAGPNRFDLGPARYHASHHICGDVRQDPAWADHLDLALQHRVQGCWSAPIYKGDSASTTDESKRLLGTLNFYLDRPSQPDHAMLSTILSAGTLASLLVQIDKRKQRTVDRQSDFDSLTDLPNRRLFAKLLADQLKRMDPKRNRLGVLVIDLDQFRQINETFGYTVGDFLLKSVARRLTDLRRENDYLARFGDDEFVFLITDVENNEQIKELAEQILTSVGEHHDFGGHQLFITASIGGCIYPWDGEDATTLMRNAESALHAVKTGSTNQYRMYAPTMAVNVYERLQLKVSLSQALEREEFELYYQPKIHSDTLEIAGAEALVRWNHPEMGLVFPGKFISVAEDTGLILPIGEWILDAGCKQVKSWRKTGYKHLGVAINISALQFREKSFLDSVAAIIDRAGLEPQAIELELTESLAMAEVDQTLERLEQLRNLGLRIAIDDFGTGYSSLSYLKRFPLDTLKIDRSFVEALPESRENSAIVKAVVAMAHYLGFEVVAEGVETAEQAAFLTESRCQLLQGFYFSRAVPADQFDKMLSAGHDPKSGKTFYQKTG